MTVLILGGTSEARAVARLLVDAEQPVISSLAGRVAEPRLPVGPVRIGGFGGINGLRTYLRDDRIKVVLDATHPFAAGITRNAFAATQAEGVPYLRLERPGWETTPEAKTWHWVDDHPAAAQRTADLGQRPMLTIGRRHLAEFVGPLRSLSVLARVVDEPEVALPQTWRLVRSRGPYTLAREREIIAEHRSDVIVTKDSGGAYTWPKLAIAAELGIPVVAVRRSAPPWSLADHVPHFIDPQRAAEAVRSLSGS